MRDFFSRGCTLVKEVLTKTSAQVALGHIHIYLSLISSRKWFSVMKAFFRITNSRNPKVIIALANSADASTEQNTSSSRQGLSVYGVTLPITDIVY